VQGFGFADRLILGVIGPADVPAAFRAGIVGPQALSFSFSFSMPSFI